MFQICLGGNEISGLVFNNSHDANKCFDDLIKSFKDYGDEIEEVVKTSSTRETKIKFGDVVFFIEMIKI